ncbi:MAG: histidine kinase [Eubacterium sp.]|nr:histidine kinase [Eubacterium sp.]
MVLVSVIMFVSISSENVEMYINQQNELNKQRFDNLILQIRPHFLYNTLSSIYYLCEQDPKKAQFTIGNFSTYLRKNLNAVVKNGPIPFTEELEHTRAYLDVEQVRFKDLLYVDYDISHTAFFLPPLTLQPIVENAVKHGVDPELSPLHIKIRTQKNDGETLLIIEDDGPGFNSNESTSSFNKNRNPHIGLSNVRERLKALCNATLEINSPTKMGGGTTVEIHIPEITV